mmetsp:Transcript_20927/g.52412  ORF Transcript_20927/g.52412 Transcript_20927/m.52412 type:complete len:367 (+) Transcript_20927:514-1614(+)
MRRRDLSRSLRLVVLAMPSGKLRRQPGHSRVPEVSADNTVCEPVGLALLCPVPRRDPVSDRHQPAAALPCGPLLPCRPRAASALREWHEAVGARRKGARGLRRVRAGDLQRPRGQVGMRLVPGWLVLGQLRAARVQHVPARLPRQQHRHLSLHCLRRCGASGEHHAGHRLVGQLRVSVPPRHVPAPRRPRLPPLPGGPLLRLRCRPAERRRGLRGVAGGAARLHGAGGRAAGGLQVLVRGTLPRRCVRRRRLYRADVCPVPGPRRRRLRQVRGRRLPEWSGVPPLRRWGGCPPDRLRDFGGRLRAGRRHVCHQPRHDQADTVGRRHDGVIDVLVLCDADYERLPLSEHGLDRAFGLSDESHVLDDI